MLLRQALKEATDNLHDTSSTPALDAEVLLGYVLGIDKTKLYQKLNNKLDEDQLQKYQKLVVRRQQHEPVAYIVKHKEFYGLDFYVDKRVLIPRPETELLVEEILQYAKEIGKQELEICDVGTGSGCIAVTLAKNLPTAKIQAIDISAAALEVAGINVKKHEVQKSVKLLRGDLLKPLKKKVDVIVANLPYVTKKRLESTEAGTTKDVRFYEPKTALLAEKGGVELYEKLLVQAPGYMKKGGLVILEIDSSFKEIISKLAQKYFPRGKITIKKDLARQKRVMRIKLQETK